MNEKDETSRLMINDRIQVTIKGSGEEVPTTYYSRVEDIKGRDYIIGWPTSRGIRAPVKDNSVIVVSFTAEDSAYDVECVVVERALEPLPLLKARPLTSLRAVQRRDFVRIPAMIDVELTPRVVTHSGAGGDKADAVSIHARTFNISGGGFAVHVHNPIRIDAFFDARFTLPGIDEPFAVLAKTVRCDPARDPAREHLYEVGFAFVEIVESIRRRIISYVFRVQQSSLMRG